MDDTQESGIFDAMLAGLKHSRRCLVSALREAEESEVPEAAANLANCHGSILALEAVIAEQQSGPSVYKMRGIRLAG